VNQTDRQLAIDAADLLNDFIGDIVTGVMAYREYDQQHRSGRLPLNLMIPIQKMCLSHLTLTLSKWLEVHEKYHAIFPTETVAVCRELNKTIRQRGIPDFRNKCIGHIWDKKVGRPLVQSEIMARLDKIVAGDLPAFLKWLNDPKGNTYPETVVSIVEKIRDDLVAQHGIRPDEIIDR
jgi:hypothetical protein